MPLLSLFPPRLRSLPSTRSLNVTIPPSRPVFVWQTLSHSSPRHLSHHHSSIDCGTTLMCGSIPTTSTLCTTPHVFAMSRRASAPHRQLPPSRWCRAQAEIKDIKLTGMESRNEGHITDLDCPSFRAMLPMQHVAQRLRAVCNLVPQH